MFHYSILKLKKEMKKTIVWHLMAVILLGISCTKDDSADNTKPLIEILSPLDDVALHKDDTLQIMVLAADPDGKIKEVSFYYDHILAGIDLAEPFEHALIMTETGEHMLIAKATDNLGSSTYSDSIAIYVEGDQSIKLYLNGPFGGQGILKNDTVEFHVWPDSPDDSIIKTSLYIDNQLFAVDSTFPYFFRWNTVPAGEYSVYATAEAESEKTGRSDTFTLMVDINTPPTIEISFPSPGHSFFLPGETIRISTTATDPDFDIARIAFFDNGVPIGTTNDDGDLYWENAAFGEHDLTAKAYDRHGGTGISEPVRIVVARGIVCDGVISDLTASEDDNLVFGLNQTKNTLLLIDPPSTSYTQITLPYPQPLAMDYSIQDQKLYIVYKFSGVVSVYNRNTNSLSEMNFSEVDDGRDISIDALHRRIYVKSTAGMYILNMDNGNILLHDESIAEEDLFVIDPEERYLYSSRTGANTTSIRKYAIAADTLNLILTYPDAGSDVKQINIHPGGDYLVLPCYGGNGPENTVYAFDAKNLTTIQGAFDIGPHPMNTAFSPDGNIMLGTNIVEDKLYIMDAHAFTEIDSRELPNAGDYCRMTTNHSGNTFFAFTYDYFYGRDYIIYFFNL